MVDWLGSSLGFCGGLIGGGKIEEVSWFAAAGLVRRGWLGGIFVCNFRRTGGFVVFVLVLALVSGE